MMRNLPVDPWKKETEWREKKERNKGYKRWKNKARRSGGGSDDGARVKPGFGRRGKVTRATEEERRNKERRERERHRLGDAEEGSKTEVREKAEGGGRAAGRFSDKADK